MQDNLEKFIEEKRDELDPYIPSAYLWQSINKQLPVKSRQINPVYYLAAACILLIVGSFIWFTKSAEQTQSGIVDTTIPEIKDAEFYYTSLAETEHSQLNKFSKAYPDVCKDIDQEMDTLHALYGQLKLDYKNSNSNEVVLQAMVENLQLQVQLLNSQLQIIRNIKQKENKQRKKVKFI